MPFPNCEARQWAGIMQRRPPLIRGSSSRSSTHPNAAHHQPGRVLRPRHVIMTAQDDVCQVPNKLHPEKQGTSCQRQCHLRTAVSMAAARGLLTVLTVPTATRSWRDSCRRLTAGVVHQLGVATPAVAMKGMSRVQATSHHQNRLEIEASAAEYSRGQ